MNPGSFFKEITQNLVNGIITKFLIFRVISPSGKNLALLTLIYNFFPVVGVLFLKWDAGNTLLFFWAGNVVAGCFHTIKLLLVERNAIAFRTRIIAVLGFAFRWFMFCLVHGFFAFVFSLLIYALAAPPGGPYFTIDDYNYRPLLITFTVSLLVQGYSFLVDYLAARKYRREKLHEIELQPFRNAIVLHLSLLVFGAFFFTIIILGVTVLQKLGKVNWQIFLSSGYFTMSLIASIILAAMKSWWDFNLLFDADKLGPYATREEKIAAAKRKFARDTGKF